MEHSTLVTLGGVAACVASLVICYFMIVSWRTMRALEKSSRRNGSHRRHRDRTNYFPQSTKRKSRDGDRSFKEFLKENPMAEYFESEALMERFEEWRGKR